MAVGSAATDVSKSFTALADHADRGSATPRPHTGSRHGSATKDIGQLAKAATADRGFPRDGDFEAISRRLNRLQADGDTHAALEQADIEAAAY